MRVNLGGQGSLIPEVALPDPNVDTNFPPQTFLFTEDGEFSKVDWAGLGYTNYEAICIGATGGRGGGASSYFKWTSATQRKAVSVGAWSLVRERAALGDLLQQASLYGDPSTGGPYQNYTAVPALNKVYKPWAFAVFTPGTNCWITDVRDATADPSYLRWRAIMQEFGHLDNLVVYSNSSSSATPYWDGTRWFGFTQWTFWQGTYLDMLELSNPLHQLTFRAFSNIELDTQFVEGIGGAPGGGGMHVVSGFLADLPDITSVIVGKAGTDAVIGQVLQNGVYTPVLSDAPVELASGYPYVDSFPSYVFGYATERARIAEIEAFLDGYLTTYGGSFSFPNPQAGQDGGASIFGDVAQASGGKGGGASIGFPGGVKTYQGFGGAGGAGDRSDAGGGGAGSIVSGVNGADGTWDDEVGKGGGGGLSAKTVAPLRQAGSGGRGSYSFADTSVYGPRQSKSGSTPGGGGGAKLNSLTHYGSKASQAIPDGVVFIRLTKID